MKKYLGFLAIVVFGCNANHQIGVSRVDTPAVVPAPQPGQAASSVTSSDGQADPTIYFEEVRSREGMDPLVIGFGFLDRDSTVTDAFLLRLNSETSASEDPAFVPITGGVLLVDTNTNGQSTIGFTRIQDLDHADLMSGKNIISVASTADQNTLGWVDQSGNAFISKTGAIHKLSLGSPDLKANRILSVGQRGELAVIARGASAKAFLFSAQSPDAELEFGADQIAVSPKGTRILLVSGNAVQVYDRQTHISKTLAVTGPIHEANWADEDRLSYWTEHSDGPVIEVLSVQTERRTEITSVDPSMAHDGLICPVWNNGELYFADNRDGKMQILRGTQEDGSWNVKTFAETSNARVGLVCPSVSSSE